MVDILDTKIDIVDLSEDGNYGKFVMSPLERGYGTTLGNSLRRVLLSSLPGTAISNIKFDDEVLHEFQTITGVVEDVPEIILNLKGIYIKRISDNTDPVNLRLDIDGPKIVTAGDITEDSNVEIVNKDHYLFTINDKGGVHMDLNVVDGKGYSVADQHKKEDSPVGTISIDSSFTPVNKVNFQVENTRVGQITDYDKLILEVWTNGTIEAKEATSNGAKILIEHLRYFEDLINYEFIEEVDEVEDEPEVDENLSKVIEDLDLSLRAFHCLKKENINTVEDILNFGSKELKKIRNFGKKSYVEVEEALREAGYDIPEDPKKED